MEYLNIVQCSQIKYLGFSSSYLAQIKYQGGVTVLLVHLAVEEDDLPPGDDHVELLPAVPPDVLLAGGLEPSLQAGLGVTQLRLSPN